MKNQFIKSLVLFMAIFTLLVTSCDNIEEANSVKITGDIENYPSDSVFVKNYENGSVVIYAYGITDGKGHFEMIFDLNEPKLLNFYTQKESTKIFVVPGDDLHISLNTEQFDETVKYEGNKAAVNNFLATYFLEYEDYGSEKFEDFYSLSRSLDTKAYYERANVELLKRTAFFEERNKAQQFDSHFVAYYRNKLKYEKPNLFSFVFFGHQDVDSIPAVRTLKINMANEMIAVKSELSKDIDVASYESYIDNSLTLAVNKLVYLEHPDIKTEDFDSIYYKNLTTYLSPEELNNYIYGDIHYYLEHFNSDYYVKKKSIVNTYLTDSTLVEKLEQEYTDLQKELNKGYAKGLNKYDYGTDENKDKTFKDILSKYKGKVIYFDIWASWCGPCKAELPYSKKLKAKFKGKEVAFIYLSTDRNQKAWENILVLMRLEGEHYRSNKTIGKYLSDEFNLEYIPHYIIFDKEGKMVQNNAPRPSSTEVISALEDLL